MDELYTTQTCKIKVNKSGYLTSYKYYAEDGSLINAVKITLNNKNLAVKAKVYNESGDLTSILKYTYNKDRRRKSKKE